MKTLWSGSWIETPAPHPVPGSVRLAVEATVPLLAHGAAHGREFARPARKVASFLITDGPRATARKARSKRAERAYSGDYHLLLVLGHDAEGNRRVALAPKAPPCAAALLVHERLTRPVTEEFGTERLRDLAARLAAAGEALHPLARQNYLYSGLAPPAELTGALDRALAAPAAAPPANVVATTLAGAVSTEAVDEVLRTGTGAGAGPPLAVLGAGDYVRIEVAPAFAAAPLRRVALADREPQIAALAAAELGFEAAFTDAGAAIDALAERGIVVVATAHDSHAALAARALDAGHRVLLEKPAVVTAADLELLEAAVERHPGELEIGFNRRHHPLVEHARRLLVAAPGPATIVATIREVDISADHWYLWPNQGTRVAGNLCHWIDLAVHLLRPGPRATTVAVSPRVAPGPAGLDAERAFTIGFDDGSVATLIPTARGDSVRGVQEQIELRRGSLALRIDDLWKLSGTSAGRPLHRRTLWRDKGHRRMYREQLGRFATGHPASYPEADLRRVAEIQLAATELLLSGGGSGDVSELLAAASRRRTAGQSNSSASDAQK